MEDLVMMKRSLALFALASVGAAAFSFQASAFGVMSLAETFEGKFAVETSWIVGVHYSRRPHRYETRFCGRTNKRTAVSGPSGKRMIDIQECERVSAVHSDRFWPVHARRPATRRACTARLPASAQAVRPSARAAMATSPRAATPSNAGRRDRMRVTPTSSHQGRQVGDSAAFRRN
jgi:hypothetical protein